MKWNRRLYIRLSRNIVEINKLHKKSRIYLDALEMMPEMDGLEATRLIRAMERTDAKTMPVIAMSANAYEEDRQLSLEAGMNDHLSKPVQPNTMYDTIIKHVTACKSL